MARRFCAGVAAGCAVALAAACGNYHPSHIVFTFTPIPVITNESAYGGTPVSIDPDTCNVFVADEVSVGIDAKERKSFERWLDDIGFTIRYGDGRERAGRLTYLVQVPPGSVPAALAIIGKQPGVRTADDNGFAYIPEATPPVLIQECKRARSTPTPI